MRRIQTIQTFHKQATVLTDGESSLKRLSEVNGAVNTLLCSAYLKT